jgi:enoyl-CoA hydratase/carnithine racemase
MDYKTLIFELEGSIGRLTLNRPERLNAINAAMLEELNSVWGDITAMPECRVVVMTGVGERGFCSGLDLKEAADLNSGFGEEGISGDSMFRGQRKFSGLIEMMRSCAQPVIAAVNGAAMGAGMSLALAADVRIAARNAKFCASYINIGLGGADMGSSYLMWRLVGWGRAAELLMTGRVIDVDEAYRIGLVNHVYDQDKLMEQADEMAHRMVEKSPLGLRLTKDALNAGLNAASLGDALRMEDRNQVMLMENLYISGTLLPDSPPPGQKEDIQ